MAESAENTHFSLNYQQPTDRQDFTLKIAFPENTKLAVKVTDKFRIFRKLKLAP